MQFRLMHYRTIMYFHAFVQLMLQQIDVDQALQDSTQETIGILLDLKKKLDTFEKEISEAFENLTTEHGIRKDYYENPLPSLGLHPIYFIVNDSDSLQFRVMEVLHNADRLIVAYSEILENFDRIGIPGAADWGEDEILTYYYNFMGERDRWVVRTRVVFNKLKEMSKPLMVSHDARDAFNGTDNSDFPEDAGSSGASGDSNVVTIETDIDRLRQTIDKLNEEIARKARNNVDIWQDVVEILDLQLKLFVQTNGQW